MHKRRAHASVRPHEARGRASLRSNWLAALVMLGGFTTLAGTLGSRIFYRRIEPTIERLFVPIAQAPDAFDSALAFYSYLFPQLLTSVSSFY